MLDKPTDRQINLAKLISRTLNIPLPSEETFKAYADYINEYYDKTQDFYM